MKLGKILIIFLFILLGCGQWTELVPGSGLGKPSGFQTVDGSDDEADDDDKESADEDGKVADLAVDLSAITLATVAANPPVRFAMDDPRVLFAREFDSLNLDDQLQAIPRWINDNKVPACLYDLDNSPADIAKILGPVSGAYLVAVPEDDAKQSNAAAMVPAAPTPFILTPAYRATAVAQQMVVTKKKAKNFRWGLKPNFRFILLICQPGNHHLLDVLDNRGRSWLQKSIARSWVSAVDALLQVPSMISQADIDAAQVLFIAAETDGEDIRFDHKRKCRDLVVRGGRQQNGRRGVVYYDLCSTGWLLSQLWDLVFAYGLPCLIIKAPSRAN